MSSNASVHLFTLKIGGLMVQKEIVDDGIVLPTLSGVISQRHWGDCLPNAKAFSVGGRRKWRAVVP